MLKGARILVTGATGFLGQHVYLALRDAGAELFQIGKRSGFDLTLEARALAAVLAAKPDVVVHLAAPIRNPGFPAGIQDPLLMGINLINACSMAGSRLVMTAAPWPGADRAVQETLLWAARASRKQHGLKFVQIVPCDLYGPSDRPGLLRHVACLVERMIEATDQKSVKLQGNPKKKFPLLYVEDAAKAVLLACELPGCDEPLRLAPKQAQVLHVDEIAAIVAKHVGFKGEISWNTDSDPWIAADHDGAAAREILEWEPKIALEKGLEGCVKWRKTAEKERK